MSVVRTVNGSTVRFVEKLRKHSEATGGNVAGYFYAFDARTGRQLWKFNTGAGVFASPAVYAIDGEEFVTVASVGGERGRRGGDLILSFALPPRQAAPVRATR